MRRYGNWWNRFGPLVAGEIRRRRVGRRNWSHWRWHLDEVCVRINGETHYLWRAVVCAKLSYGGSVTMPLSEQFWGSYFGMCTDRFGINWMVSCPLSRD